MNRTLRSRMSSAPQVLRERLDWDAYSKTLRRPPEFALDVAFEAPLALRSCSGPLELGKTTLLDCVAGLTTTG